MLLSLRELTKEDKNSFLDAMKRSQPLHQPWVKAPLTSTEFDEYLHKSQQPNQKSYILFEDNNIAGIFNLNEIIHGVFQNAFLGFYAVSDYAGKGYMSAGLKLLLDKVFNELKLHRLQAGIQPENIRSIQLVKKNGFRYEGYSPRYLKIYDEWRGHEMWAITYEDYIKNDDAVTKRDLIDIVPYNPEWSKQADIEISRIRDILNNSNVIDIQHVGSTAIPGIAAKPIIDIQVGVKSLNQINSAIIQDLQKLGYEYWYENPDSTRMFFVKGMPPFGKQRTHHIHIFEFDSDHWRNKIIFRDYLRSHPDTAKEYENLKIKLSKTCANDREKYTAEKFEFIKKILALWKNDKLR